MRDRRGDLGRGAAAVPRAQRLHRGDLPHVLLQPAVRRRRRDRRDAVRRQRGHRAGHRRAPDGDAARPRRRTRRRSGPRPRCSPRRAGASRRPALDLPFALVYLFDDDGDDRAARGRAGIGAGTRPRRRPSTSATPDAVWPAAALAAGETALRRRPRARFAGPADRRVGRAAAAGARRAAAAAGPAAPVRVPGRRRSTRYRAARRRLPRRSSSSSPARSRPGIADARAYEAERPPGRDARRARPGEDRVLHQRQPRVPHAADAAARPGRGRARRRRRRRCPTGQRERVEVDPAQRASGC